MGSSLGTFTPEAYVGGPLALVKNGDEITIDAKNRTIDVKVSAAEMKRRLKSWKRPKPKYTRGVLAKYAHTVSSASEGAVTDENLDL